MRKLIPLFVGVAVVAGITALALWLQRGQVEVPELPSAPPPQAPPPRPDQAGEANRPQQGGIYEGRVEDREGVPVPGARVLLIAYQAGDPEQMQAYERALSSGSGMPDPALIPTIGGHEIAAEKVADQDGAFRIAADRKAYISHVIAYRVGYFPEVLLLGGRRPDEEGVHRGIVVRVRRAGRVLGRVVDDESGDPVPGARVDISLQQKTRPPPAMGEDGASGARSADGESIPLSPMVTLGSFLYAELGERVWGIPQQSREGLVLHTDENGAFELGPLADSVQLEFIVTHPEYKWIDFDNPDGKTPPRRSVVEPGETLEKELRLRRGGEVQGRVIDEETGEPFVDALVEVESISAYWMHWWYRSKKRRTRTDDQGRFRVAGLAIGDQSIHVRHPSFGRIQKPGVSPGAKDVVIYAERFAGLQATVSGLVGRPSGGRVSVHMHRLRDDGNDESVETRIAVLNRGGQFQLSRIKPARYRIWLRAGTETSQPQTLDLEPLQTAHVTFVLGGGGELRLPLRDAEGASIDRASATLIRYDGESERVLGKLVSREGQLEADGIVPGRYRLEIQARGYIPLRTEPFEVVEGRVAVPSAGAFVPYARLRIGPLLDERGRPLGGDRGVAVIEMRRGEDGPWRRLMGLRTEPMTLPPGPVSVRARVEQAGLAFEATEELVGGELTAIEIRFEER